MLPTYLGTNLARPRSVDWTRPEIFHLVARLPFEVIKGDR